MIRALVYNGHKYWNGLKWVSNRKRAKVFGSISDANYFIKNNGSGTVIRVKKLILESDVTQHVTPSIEFTYLTWVYSELEAGEIAGCFDTEEEALDLAEEEITKIVNSMPRANFVKIPRSEPHILHYWENKWADRIKVLKLKIE